MIFNQHSYGFSKTVLYGDFLYNKRHLDNFGFCQKLHNMIYFISNPALTLVKWSEKWGPNRCSLTNSIGKKIE